MRIYEIQNTLKSTKITDYYGNPLVVYHGSYSKFDSFEHGHNNGATIPRHGFYFTDEEEVASEFGKTKAYYLDIHNPADFSEGHGQEIIDRIADRNEKWENELKTEFMKKYGTPNMSVYRLTVNGELQTPFFISELKHHGFDGMIFDDCLGKSLPFTSYVAFEPDQIIPA